MLEFIDLSQELPKQEYKKRLPPLRRRLLQLQRAAWQAGIPTLVVFEGWDAAGKGPLIRKLTQRLEPRGFAVHSLTDRPRSYEYHLPFMWRFWLSMPNYGEMAIFERSWHRRALTARVEGKASDLEWRRTLRNIADFERTLADDGYLIVKFFLHISRDEQKARYAKWKKDPEVSFKLEDKEWLSLEHYEQYLPYVEELLEYTEAAWGPWAIIPATDQRWARIAVFERLILRMEKTLAERGETLPEPYDDPSDHQLDEAD